MIAILIPESAVMNLLVKIMNLLAIYQYLINLPFYIHGFAIMVLLIICYLSSKFIKAFMQNWGRYLMYINFFIVSISTLISASRAFYTYIITSETYITYKEWVPSINDIEKEPTSRHWVMLAILFVLVLIACRTLEWLIRKVFACAQNKISIHLTPDSLR